LISLSVSKEAFLEEIEKPMLGMLDILLMFPSLNPPMDAFFTISDRIMVSIFFTVYKPILNFIENYI